ncbi:MAG: hypothetical protein L0Z62_21115 [Gemmataceae bacterium]|nr:hypothetical protein [Gemmataceae bacterium]
MTMHQARIAEVVRRDPRYAYEAYEFVYDALTHTQRLLGRQPRDPSVGELEPQHHVRGRELLEGIRDLALRQFGLMARTVFRLWGIQRTDDFGEIVFNLVAEKLMTKTEDDCLDDFRNVYDLDQALVYNYRIRLEEAE